MSTTEGTEGTEDSGGTTGSNGGRRYGAPGASEAERSPWAPEAERAPWVVALPPGPQRMQPLDALRWTFRPLAFLEENHRRYGDSFMVRAIPGRPPMAWLGEPDAIRDVFAADGAAVHAGEANFIVEPLLGKNSLLMLDGEAHRRERKLMMPPFHGDRMRAYGHAMRASADAAIDRFQVGERVVILDVMQAITLEIVVRTVFGIEDAREQRELSALLREVLALASDPMLYGLALMLGPNRLRDLITSGSRPLRLGPFQLDLSPLVPGSRVFQRLGEVDRLLFSEFARRRASGAIEGATDVLSMLLAARDEDGRAMSDVELRDEMMTLLLAGHETTATSLAWAVHHLLGDPRILSTLRAELAPLAARGALEPEEVAAAAYLDAVIKETMRLTPVVPLVARVTKRDARFGRYRIPAGTIVMPSVYLTHHRPDLYPEPDRFRPERFLERKMGPHEFLPFGGGLRRCIGAAFATYEMKVVLAELATRATLERAPGTVRLERRGLMFAPSGGVPVIVRARN